MQNKLQSLKPSLETYLERCNFPPANTSVSCAVSGGADSIALTLLAKAAGCEVQALHIDHQLRPDSHTDSEVVEKFAKSLDIEFQCIKVDVEKGQNIEANARKARYLALDRIDKNTLLGHTSDDQAETLLLNLLWGSGPDGLAAMRYDHRRPILELRRQDTEQICKLYGVEPIHDPMNADPSFRRNRIRNEVIPLLNEITGKDIVPILCRSAKIFRQTSELLDGLAQDIDPTDAKAIKELDPPLGAWVIKRWLAEKDPPDFAAIERVLAVARGEIQATEIPGGHRVSRSSMRLSLETDLAPNQPNDRDQ